MCLSTSGRVLKHFRMSGILSREGLAWRQAVQHLHHGDKRRHHMRFTASQGRQSPRDQFLLHPAQVLPSQRDVMQQVAGTFAMVRRQFREQSRGLPFQREHVFDQACQPGQQGSHSLRSPRGRGASHCTTNQVKPNENRETESTRQPAAKPTPRKHQCPVN